MIQPFSLSAKIKLKPETLIQKITKGNIWENFKEIHNFYIIFEKKLIFFFLSTSYSAKVLSPNKMAIKKKSVCCAPTYPPILAPPILDLPIFLATLKNLFKIFEMSFTRPTTWQVSLPELMPTCHMHTLMHKYITLNLMHLRIKKIWDLKNLTSKLSQYLGANAAADTLG